VLIIQKTIVNYTAKRITIIFGKMLAIASMSWLTALEMAIFGYFPGISDVDLKFTII
jgi:ABC-type Na+ efflux pump permease subunit